MSTTRQRRNLEPLKGQKHGGLIHKLNQRLPSPVQWDTFRHHRPSPTDGHQGLLAHGGQFREESRSALSTPLRASNTLRGMAHAEAHGLRAQPNNNCTVSQRRSGQSNRTLSFPDI